MQPIKFFNKNSSAKTLSALWFSALATIAVFILPALQWISSLLLTRGDQIKNNWTPDAYFVLTTMILHVFIPVIAAAVFGGRLGECIIVQHSTISAKYAFGRGVKIAFYSAIAWLIAGMGWLALMARFTDVSRLSGVIFVLAIFGFPIYASLGGVGGVVLKKIAAFRSA